MLGIELRLPDQLNHGLPLEENQPQNEFVPKTQERLTQAYEVLSQQQYQIRQEDAEEPPPSLPQVIWSYWKTGTEGKVKTRNFNPNS